MARTPQEIFDHHIHAIVTRDIDALLADYADDAVLITSGGVARGKAGVLAVFTKFLGDVADVTFDTRTQILEGDVLFLEWSVDSRSARVEGSDTFVFHDNLIRAQTITRSVHHKR